MRANIARTATGSLIRRPGPVVALALEGPGPRRPARVARRRAAASVRDDLRTTRESRSLLPQPHRRARTGTRAEDLIRQALGGSLREEPAGRCQPAQPRHGEIRTREAPEGERRGPQRPLLEGDR